MSVYNDRKIAVVLFNLGGPSAPEDIRPFLFNFFMDKNIIRAPLPIRYLVAQLISITRSRGAAKESYSALGGASPLLANTRAQADALAKVLADEIPDARVFVAMRYWHPRARDVVREVMAYGADTVVLLPLYPQFSTTTTFSSVQEWNREAQAAGLHVPTRIVSCYPDDPGFVAASADLITKAISGLTEPYRLLFSAHGLPEKVIQDGDPYAEQCRITAASIVNHINLPVVYWKLCYQSRVGPMKWIGPSIDETLQQAAEQKAGVVIYPPAFVNEHVETLVELDIEYKERAHELGIPFYIRVPTVGTHPLFIDGLKNLVLSALDDDAQKKEGTEHG